jgi:hypothetical protein
MLSLLCLLSLMLSLSLLLLLLLPLLLRLLRPAWPPLRAGALPPAGPGP